MHRARPLPEPVARAALQLQRSEAKIALLDRVRPRNFAAEQARLSQAFTTGQRLKPAFEYGERAELGDVRRELNELANALDVADTEQQLLAERARELELEAALAEHVADAEFTELARKRFPLPEEPSQAHRLAEQFLTAPPLYSQETSAIFHESDDPRDPRSLWSELSRRLSQERFAVRIEVVPGLVTLAAVAEGVVRVRPGARLTSAVARRIALHEVEGHVRPRVHGRELGGVFMAGSARASEDEEGRAILLEERAGLLDGERRKELARRYLAAEGLRQGADFWQTVDVLGRAGATLGAAVELACRVHRGGGLGRELIYLTGYARVLVGLASRPELERVLESGRVSLSAAALLEPLLELDDDRDMV
jgi:hypothetical protein